MTLAERRRAVRAKAAETRRIRMAELARLRLARKWALSGADLEAMELLQSVTMGWPSERTKALLAERAREWTVLALIGEDGPEIWFADRLDKSPGQDKAK